MEGIVKFAIAFFPLVWWNSQCIENFPGQQRLSLIAFLIPSERDCSQCSFSAGKRWRARELRVLLYAGLMKWVYEQQARKKQLMKLEVVALSANKKGGKEEGLGPEPSRSSEQLAVDGDTVHVGIGTVAVLQGIFLVLFKWNNSASTDGQGPIPSRQSGDQCAQREAAAQLRSSQAEQGRVCGCAIRHLAIFVRRGRSWFLPVLSPSCLQMARVHPCEER